MTFLKKLWREKFDNLFPSDELLGHWIGKKTRLGYFGIYGLLFILYYLSWPLATIFNNYPLSFSDSSLWGQTLVNIWLLLMIFGAWILNSSFNQLKNDLSIDFGPKIQEVLSTPYKTWIRLIILILYIGNCIFNIFVILPSEVSDPNIIGNTDIVLFSRFGLEVGIYIQIIANLMSFIVFADIITLIWFVFILPRILASETRNVKIFHPDQRGGFSPIGQFCLAFSIVSFLVVTYNTLMDLVLIIWLPMFLNRMNLSAFLITSSSWIIIIGLFIWTQWPFHKILKHEKEKYLKMFADRIHDSRVLEDSNSFEESVVILQRFRVYDELRSMNDWPFNMGIFLKFIISAASAIGLQLLAIIIGLLSENNLPI